MGFRRKLYPTLGFHVFIRHTCSAACRMCAYQFRPPTAFRLSHMNWHILYSYFLLLLLLFLTHRLHQWHFTGRHSCSIMYSNWNLWSANSHLQHILPNYIVIEWCCSMQLKKLEMNVIPRRFGIPDELDYWTMYSCSRWLQHYDTYYHSVKCVV